MKIVFDVDVIKNMGITRMVHQVHPSVELTI